MEIYKELCEIEELREKTKSQKDTLLDIYSKHPEKVKKLLIDVIEVEKELNELEEDFIKLQNEIY
jgi:hypothetical protein